MRIQRRALVALTVGIAVLSACGFQLRGSNGQSALPFKTIYVGVPESSPLGVQLKRYIRASGDTQIVTDPKAAEATLDILSETRDKKILSLNTQGRIREYTLFYRVR